MTYNNAVFSEEDIASLSNIGDSRKKALGSKTGRFGVGFNACYHITDLPSFVSSHHLVFLDPQAKHLPDVTAANPGAIDCTACDENDRFRNITFGGAKVRNTIDIRYEMGQVHARDIRFHSFAVRPV